MQIYKYTTSINLEYHYTETIENDEIMCIYFNAIKLLIVHDARSTHGQTTTAIVTGE